MLYSQKNTIFTQLLLKLSLLSGIVTMNLNRRLYKLNTKNYTLLSDLITEYIIIHIKTVNIVLFKLIFN